MSDSAVFHWGEREAQGRAGFTERATAVSRMVRSSLPRGAAAFLTHQNLLVTGGQDDDGRPWASMFTGPRGFVSAPDDETVQVLARLAPDDPVEPMTRREGRLGMLAIDLETRIRLRMNGTVTPLRDGLHLTIEQSFPNCPKYIQKRSVTGWRNTEDQGSFGGTRTDALTGPMTDLITRADTFFVATASDTGDPDVSHRGGDPGFVTLTSPTRLSWPDYAGNNMLMTLGNIIENPRTALLFIDWTDGTALHLTGHAAIHWPETTTGTRSVSFEIEEAVHRPRALTANWSAPVMSRFNPPLAA